MDKTENGGKVLALRKELETSRKLITAGFGNLQEIDMGNDFYHLAHLLMASGIEKLMKCFIILIEHSRSGSYPSSELVRKFGHDLDKLLNSICDKYYDVNTCLLLANELAFLKKDNSLLRKCVQILSEFGGQGRYHNLDYVTGRNARSIDPETKWKELETTFEDIRPYGNDEKALLREYYPRVNARIISVLERMVRAIALQFTLGCHAKDGSIVKQQYVVYRDFIRLTNEEFGTVDYRRSVEILRRDRHKWIKRSERAVLKSKWPSRVLHRRDFGDEWPFRVDRVIVQRKDSIFCLVYIDKYMFALNGAASSRFDLPSPHDTGEAILGKSIGRFIDIARSL